MYQIDVYENILEPNYEKLKKQDVIYVEFLKTINRYFIKYKFLNNIVLLDDRDDIKINMYNNKLIFVSKQNILINGFKISSSKEEECNSNKNTITLKLSFQNEDSIIELILSCKYNYLNRTFNVKSKIIIGCDGFYLTILDNYENINSLWDYVLGMAPESSNKEEIIKLKNALNIDEHNIYDNKYLKYLLLKEYKIISERMFNSIFKPIYLYENTKVYMNPITSKKEYYVFKDDKFCEDKISKLEKDIIDYLIKFRITNKVEIHPLSGKVYLCSSATLVLFKKRNIKLIKCFSELKLFLYKNGYWFESNDEDIKEKIIKEYSVFKKLTE